MSKYKSGLDYFSFDIDFFNDEKIEFISARFGIQGEIIAIKLLCKIYRNGYFLKWGEDECLLFSRKVGEGITTELIDGAIEELLKREFFDEQIFKKYQVLTSRGIQKRYLEAIKRRKEVIIYKEYFLLNRHNANIINQNVNIISLNADILEQSKVKESKVKESKGKESKEKKREREEVQKSISASLDNKSVEEEKKKANNIEFDQELLSWHGVDEDIFDDWVKRFPNIDVPVELIKIREYFKNNPGKEKGIKNFAIYINDWLERAEKYRIADSIK